MDDYNCHAKMQDTTKISSQLVGHQIFAFGKPMKRFFFFFGNSGVWLKILKQEFGHGLFADSRCMLLSIVVLLLTTIRSLSSNQ